MKYRVDSEVTLIGGRVVKYTHVQDIMDGASVEQMELEVRRCLMTKFIMSKFNLIKAEPIGECYNRLTKWNGQKYILPQGRTADGESYWRLIAERLAAYENTGLEPRQIEKLIGWAKEGLLRDEQSSC